MKNYKKQYKRRNVAVTDLGQVIFDLSSRDQMRLISKELSAKDIESINKIIIQESDDIKKQYYSTNIEVKKIKNRTFSELLKKFLDGKTHNMYA